MTEKELEVKKEKQYWPVFIPSKFLTKIKTKDGRYMWILEFSNKQVYIPFEWLRQHPKGKGYIGSFKIDHEMTGNVKTPIKVNTNEWLKYFPPKKMGDE